MKFKFYFKSFFILVMLFFVSSCSKVNDNEKEKNGLIDKSTNLTLDDYYRIASDIGTQHNEALDFTYSMLSRLDEPDSISLVNTMIRSTKIFLHRFNEERGFSDISSINNFTDSIIDVYTNNVLSESDYINNIELESRIQAFYYYKIINLISDTTINDKEEIYKSLDEIKFKIFNDDRLTPKLAFPLFVGIEVCKNSYAYWSVHNDWYTLFSGLRAHNPPPKWFNWRDVWKTDVSKGVEGALQGLIVGAFGGGLPGAGAGALGGGLGGAVGGSAGSATRQLLDHYFK